jgi:hypothetical protein
MKCVKFVACILALSAAEAKADRYPRWVTILPLVTTNTAVVAADAVRLGNNTIVDGIAYMCNLMPEGNPAADRAAVYAEQYRKIEPLVRKNSSVRQGVLLQATMGHCTWPGDPTRWQQCIKPNGEAAYRYCPLDRRFLEYIAAQCKTLSALNPDFFMLDDDTRLVWDSELPGCFCPLHLASLEAKTGRKWTREQVVVGLKAKDKQLTTAWGEIKFGSLRELFKIVRASFAESTPGMICVVPDSVHFKHAREIAEIMAAPGQIPVIRGGGAPYHNSGKDLFHIIDQRFKYAKQLASVGDGIEYMMEADTCPRTLWATSATREYSEIVMMALEGVKGAKIWITRLENPYEYRSGKMYREVFEQNCGLMKWAGSTRFTQKGVVIPLVGSARNSFAGRYLSLMGFPYRFGTAQADEITALTANTVENLSKADIAKILEGRVIMDGGAAVLLAKMGYGAHIGVEAAEWRNGLTQAHILEDGVVANGVARKGLADLNRCSASARVLTHIVKIPHMGAEPVPATPGSLLFENACGGRVIVVAQSLQEQMPAYLNSEMQSESYKTQMAKWLARLSGHIPGGVYYRGDGPVLCESLKTSLGEDIVVLEALDLDDIKTPELVFGNLPKKVERMSGDGSWKEVSFEQGSSGSVFLKSEIRTQRPAIFRIGCKQTR